MAVGWKAVGHPLNHFDAAGGQALDLGRIVGQQTYLAEAQRVQYGSGRTVDFLVLPKLSGYQAVAGCSAPVVLVIFLLSIDLPDIVAISIEGVVASTDGSARRGCVVEIAVPPVIELVCVSVGGAGDVDVTWLNQDVYDEINIYVDGVLDTTVDGADETWRRSRAAIGDPTGAVSIGAANDERFADRGELRYSLRSLWAHAPFFRHVFVVTAQTNVYRCFEQM